MLHPIRTAPLSSPSEEKINTKDEPLQAFQYYECCKALAYLQWHLSWIDQFRFLNDAQ